MTGLISAIRVLGQIWLALVGLLIVAGNVWMVATGQLHIWAWNGLMDSIFNPFNVAAMAIALAPGYGLTRLSNWLQRRAER